MATTHEDRLRELTAENALTDAERAACLAGAEALRLVREAMALTRDAKIARLIDDIVSCADEADGRKADARAYCEKLAALLSAPVAQAHENGRL